MSDNVTWLVRRFHWRKLPTSAEPRYVRFPGAVTVAEFEDRADAEADRWARELALRDRINPFRCGFELADCTHLPAYAFKDFLMDDSVRPAKYDSYARVDWGKWWDKHSPGWNFDRRGRIWEALDKVRFFEVVGREADRQAFVAVEGVCDIEPEPLWERMRYWPDVNDFGTEGGRPVRAFCSRADADAYLELIAETNNDPARTQPDTDPFTNPDSRVGLPADRAHDVPLDSELSADLRTVFVVCRAGLALNRHRYGDSRWMIDGYRTGQVEWVDSIGDFDGDFDVPPRRRDVRRPRLVPEAAFTTREAAEVDARERMRAARRWLNPHLVYDFVRSGGDQRAAAIWWSANVSNAPDAEFDAAWAGFSHLSIYEVVEVEFDA